MKVLVLLVAFCAFATAMVPRDKREASEGEAPKICAPSTPCAWQITNKQTNMVEQIIPNTYCNCAVGFNCELVSEKSFISGFEYRCLESGGS
ncbi:unnamed protein product [Leptosia nina]|uniref:Uncharacterized protein n=1 Tax=Leptosia nina TaxID=320188 RepID=A0AAV1K3J5_9NEOP